MTITIGIDVGGTNIRFGVFNQTQLIEEIRLESNLSKLCGEMLPEHASYEVVQIGRASCRERVSSPV